MCIPSCLGRCFCWCVCLLAGMGEVALALEPVPEKLVVLTFDDSAKSHFTVVRPLLKQYGFSATFFVTEGFDFKENRRDYMSWEEISQLHADGFEIGNHTRDHLSITDQNLDQLAVQLEGINQRCTEHQIPKPISFAWPGNAIAPQGLDRLAAAGIRFARRGGGPEFAYEQGRGFAYEPMLDHPLLIPSAGDARPDWELEDFVRAVEQSRSGRIAVLQFHGVPDTAHDWVTTPQVKFAEYMRYLAVEGYRGIALRDLEHYVDPTVAPQNPRGVIEDRQRFLTAAQAIRQFEYDNIRPPHGDRDLRFWLQNMLYDHHYSVSEVSAATGLSAVEIETARKRLQADGPIELPSNVVRVLPYPGGRHPRIGFRDGAIRPQRETKLSAFLPWHPSSYVVLDVPEAFWWNANRDGGGVAERELLYLAHTHVPTTWDKQGITLAPTEWERTESGWSVTRTLPNGIAFGCDERPQQQEVRLRLWIRNDSKLPLTGLVAQNCTMLAGAAAFASRSSANKVVQDPFVACHDETKTHWIVTGWERCVRSWDNPPCPCIHSDPQFPDCLPGQTQELQGVVSFYVGTNINAEFDRLRKSIE